MLKSNILVSRWSSGCSPLLSFWSRNLCQESSASRKRIRKYDAFYQTLELEIGSSQDLVRRQYILLVKQFHPDTGPDGNMERFLAIDEAYKQLQKKFILDKKLDEESSGEYGLYYQPKPEDFEEEYEKIEHPDIRHTAPQHRQYLDNEGFGFGPPGQRQRQYQNIRAMKAADNVLQHRVDKLSAQYETHLATQERKHTKKHTTSNAMERLVEDLITESMSKGEFDNLSGFGKPLKHRLDFNPYMDFTAHKMNEILVEGGFAPEWIKLKKDIRVEIDRIRKAIEKKRTTLGTFPLVGSELKAWTSFCESLQSDVRSLNRSIDNYNLMVPMLNGQMFHYDLERETLKVLEQGTSVCDVPSSSNSSRKPSPSVKEHNSQGWIYQLIKDKLDHYFYNFKRSTR
eukprot:maker-scaffold239_size242058-snap-gene-0.15 protein:Tk09811 transcript:maker-scaffold239_size242058-snap-gene-0.15-mRNA-1 annotation:"j domain-containing protein"